jgi:hypothetical protein
MDEAGGECSTRGKDKKCIQILVRKPEQRRPLGRSGRRLEDNIRMNIRIRVREVVDWIYLAQNREQCWDFVNTVMNFRVP